MTTITNNLGGKFFSSTLIFRKPHSRTTGCENKNLVPNFLLQTTSFKDENWEDYQYIQQGGKTT